MKKTMLWGTIFTLICMQAQADSNQQPTQIQNTGSPASTPTNKAIPSTSQTTSTQNQGANPSPQTQGQPLNPQSNPVQNPQQIEPGQQTTGTPKAQVPPVINCDYKISAETKAISQSLVLTWSEKATVQAFDFDSAKLEAQMQQLKVCFTDQGWIGFNAALQKSGNLKAIKDQNLTVSSQVDGLPQITEIKENQWKIALPLEVVYQNDKEKVTQLLNVQLTVARKMSGDLGITQMIATPRTVNAASQPNQPNTSTTNEQNPASGATTHPGSTPQ